MTSERDFDRLARAWLELGPNEAPDRAVAAVLQAAETTPQVRRLSRWPFGRHLTMNRLPVAAGAAAVIVVAVGGAILLGRGGQSTGAGGPPAATPTSSPTATPTTFPAPTPSSLLSVKVLDTSDLNSAQRPGAYRSGLFLAPFAFNTASNWTVDALSAAEFRMHGGADDSGYVEVDLIADVFADPCHANGKGGPRPSPAVRTVDGIVAALAEMKGFAVSGTKDIVIDGHAGKEFDLSNSLDTATPACDGGGLIPIWTKKELGRGRTSTNPGSTDHIAIIDVGGEPIGIGWAGSASIFPEVDTLVRAIDFE
jgi:hypothetical protein